MANKRELDETIREPKKPGRTIGINKIPEQLGSYRVVGELGRGGMGVVFEAEDTTLGRRVGIKLLPESIADSPEARTALEREAQLLASLNHPNICTIYSLERIDGHRFFSVELIDGQDLSAILEEGPLDLQRVVEVFTQIARALESAHRAGVVHCDLKPQNVMITAEDQVKILDFGIAQALAGDAKGEDYDTQVVGTPGYMSPEQLNGEPVTTATDLWAFGCLLYECLTGEMAFGGSTLKARARATLAGDVDLTKIPEETPRALEQLVTGCLTNTECAQRLNAESIRKVLEKELNATRKRHFRDVQDSVQAVMDNALRVGDTLPDFTLESADGQTYRRADLLAKGPLTLVFYRGGW